MKNTKLGRALFRTLATYSAASFLWVAFIAAGMSNSNVDISSFASRLVTSNIFLFGYSAVYGFSLYIMEAKKLSGPAKRSLHILVNYIGVLACCYALNANINHAEYVTPSTYIVVVLLGTVAFFAIYGLVSLVAYLFRKKQDKI